MRALPFLLLLQACAGSPSPARSRVEFTPNEYDLSDLIFPAGAPPRSMEVIDTLQNPLRVEGWTRDALLLVGGKQVPMPDAGDLRDHSIMLAEATSRGVEFRNGRVVGLVRVWHWCGNDPIARHLAR